MRAIIVLGLLAVSTPALSIEANVRAACTSDYLSLCYYTVPGSQECRRCFKLSGPRLSTECRAALRASAEFGGEYARARRRYGQWKSLGSSGSR